ncbi:MAG: hypothetical protein KJ915_00090 [Candidatus Omnitrophica bacterium]|nr:hypothetical protein [Candidatus Omnitrophota bacterium]
MNTKPTLLPKSITLFTFIVGILCALGFRALIVLDKLNPSYVRTVWYFSVIGYIYFFAFRYYISVKRRNIIKNNDLLLKLSQKESLSEQDKELISYILLSIIQSKESANYCFIFVMSIFAIILDLFILK